MSKKGIIIDVGFASDTKELIDKIESSLNDLDFDEALKLDDAFDRQIEKIKQKLVELKRDMDSILDGGDSKTISKQIASLASSIKTLQKNFLELAQILPKDKLKQTGVNFAEIESQVDGVSKSLKSAEAAVNAINQTETSKLQDELQELQEVLKNISNFEPSFDNAKTKKGIDRLQKELSSLAEKYDELWVKAEHSNGIELVNVRKEILATSKSFNELYNSAQNSLSQKDFDKLNQFKIGDLNIEDYATEILDTVDNMQEQIEARIQSIKSSLLSVDEIVEEVQKETATSNRKITIPIIINEDNNITKLTSTALNIINSVQKQVDKQPLEFHVALITEYASRKNQAMLQEIKEQISNIQDGEIKTELSKLTEDIQKQFNEHPGFDVRVRTETALQTIKSFVDTAKTSLEDFEKYLPTLHPRLELSAAAKKNFINQISTAFETLKIKLKDLQIDFDITPHLLNNFNFDNIQTLSPLVLGLTRINTQLERLTTNNWNGLQKLQEILTDLVDLFKSSDLASGIKKTTEQVASASGSLGEVAEQSLADAQDSHSPSKVAEQLGEYFGEGYADGILNSSSKIKNAIRALVEEAKLTLKDLTEDTVHTAESDKVYAEIVNGKAPTKVAAGYQKKINSTQHNDEVQIFLSSVEMLKGSKVWQGISNAEENIEKFVNEIKANLLSASEAIEQFVKLSSFDNVEEKFKKLQQWSLDNVIAGGKNKNIAELAPILAEQFSKYKSRGGTEELEALDSRVSVIKAVREELEKNAQVVIQTTQEKVEAENQIQEELKETIELDETLDSSKQKRKKLEDLEAKTYETKTKAVNAFNRAFEKYVRLLTEYEVAARQGKSGKAVDSIANQMTALSRLFPSLKGITGSESAKSQKSTLRDEFLKPINEEWVKSSKDSEKQTAKDTTETKKNTEEKKKNTQAKKENASATKQESKEEKQAAEVKEKANKTSKQKEAQFLSEKNATQEFTQAFGKYINLLREYNELSAKDDKTASQKKTQLTRLGNKFPSLQKITDPNNVDFNALFEDFKSRQNAVFKSSSEQTKKDTVETKKNTDETKKNTKAKEENTKAKKDGAKEKSGAEESAKGAEKEKKSLSGVMESAQNAASAKKEFAEANKKVLKSIIDSLNGLNTEGKAFENLKNLINTINGKDGATKLQNTVNGLKEIQQALAVNTDQDSLLSVLERLANKGDSLKDLAEVLKATKKQIETAKESLSDQQSSNVANLLNNKGDMVHQSATAWASGFGKVINITEQLKKDIIEVSALIEDADGEVRKITATSTDGLYFQRTATEEGTTAIQRQLFAYEKLRKKMEEMYRIPAYATDEIVFDKNSDPDLWQEMLDLAKQYTNQIGSLVKVSRQVRQDKDGNLLESFRFEGTKGYVTSGREGDIVASGQELANINSVIKAFERLKKSAVAYWTLKQKSLNGQAIDAEKVELEKIESEYKDICAYIQQMADDQIDVTDALKAQQDLQEAISGSFAKSLNSEINTLSTQIANASKNKDFVESYRQQIKETEAIFEELKDMLRMPDRTLWSDEELQKIATLRSRLEELKSGMNLKENLAGSANQLEKLLTKIADDLNKNTRMPRELKEEYTALQHEIQEVLATGQQISKIDVNNLTSQFLRLHRVLQESGKTGKSFFHQIADFVKSKNAQFFAHYFSFQDIIRYSRQAFESVRALDTALVDLKKTTSMSATELERFYYDSNNVAKSLGVTTEEVINQAAAWSRLNILGLLYSNI